MSRNGASRTASLGGQAAPVRELPGTDAAQPGDTQPGTLQGWPIYAIYQGTDGRWMFYVHGAVRELRGDETPEGEPPSLTAH